MSKVQLRQAGMKQVVWRKVGWRQSDNTLDYPSGAILHFDANTDPYTEQTGGPHTFNYAILAPQYQRQSDGASIDVGAKVAADFYGGERWVRSCGVITNLFGGDTSIARSVTLTAQAYTLQVFGAGTVTCSYGTSTVSTPLTFTATAGATTFTPTGATRWMLTATAYPVPYVPPGVTQPASNATATNGMWFANPNNLPLWKALTGQTPLTLATRIRMGTGSADWLTGVAVYPYYVSQSVSGYLQYSFLNGANIHAVTSNDGGVSANTLPTTWPRISIIRRITQVNTARTQYRVGYMIEGTHTAIQWGSWVAFDGSFNPSTLYRLLLGYNNPYPMWFSKITVVPAQVADAEILGWWV